MEKTTDELLVTLTKLAGELKLLTSKEAAFFLGYKEGRLRFYRDAPMKKIGPVPYVRMPNGRIYYAAADLKKWLEQRKKHYGR